MGQRTRQSGHWYKDKLWNIFRFDGEDDEDEETDDDEEDEDEVTDDDKDEVEEDRDSGIEDNDCCD